MPSKDLYSNAYKEFLTNEKIGLFCLIHRQTRFSCFCPHLSTLHHSNMSLSNSINMSNESPASYQALLPFLHPPMPVPPTMSPHTVANTLCTNDDLNEETLQMIANSLLSTIAKRETDTAILHLQHAQCIQQLEDKVNHYEQTFQTPPNRYSLNDRHIHNFKIPVGLNLYRLAKWVKLNPDGTVSSYADTQGPNDNPYIIDLYMQPDPEYDTNADIIPPAPIPGWFRHLLIRPIDEFLML
jgi:hypothetical protein